MTATRQATTQKHMWSLDELTLDITVGGSLSGSSDDGFIVKGLNLEGAQWNEGAGALAMTPELSSKMPECVFRWIRYQDAQLENMTELPVYINSQRNKVLFAIRLNGGEYSSNAWYQRGVGLTVWSKN